jgi:NADH dehydrogenase [ubiquinone] 1 alpha subcomplex assembly factor 7
VKRGADLSLKGRLVAEIVECGPIDVAAFVTRCLHDPAHGYYATRPALGAAGDFITAPTISQMFGELIGLWLAETWRGLGSPSRVILAEAGPGDGTLMADILRAHRLRPFLDACEVWLIERSQPLRARQAERLDAAAPRWADSLAEAARDRPLFLVANEFLDCLPARQFQRTRRGWAERVVGVGADGELAFGLRPVAIDLPAAELGALVERSPAQEAFALELAGRIVAQGGAALLIDYGAAEPGTGDTLQALRGHRREDPLLSPGEADLTVHADFPSVLAAARRAGAEAGLITQRAFLSRLGVEVRAAALTAAHPGRAEVISRQLERLVAPHEMGELFKAAAIWTGRPPPGFEAPA